MHADSKYMLYMCTLGPDGHSVSDESVMIQLLVVVRTPCTSRWLDFGSPV